jgi:hypothetical protein
MPISQIVTNSIANGAVTSADLAAGAALSNLGTSQLASANMPAGSVLQVVHGVTSTLVSNSTTSYVDTTLTATITPKFANSKILIIISQSTYKSVSNSGNAANILLLRNATSLGRIIYVQGYTNAATELYSIASAQFFDSPNSTSALTYKTQLANLVPAAFVSTQPDGLGGSTITLMEIAQ